jgi:hypothetical protein
MSASPGQVYLYHLTGRSPPWNHYIGFTTQPAVRHRHHRERRTAISRDVAALGGTMTLVMTRPGSLAVEAALKRDPSRWRLYCPRCNNRPLPSDAPPVLRRRAPRYGPARARLSDVGREPL